jgi:glycosyltransferase involved in cell wall biosynthesis
MQLNEANRLLRVGQYGDALAIYERLKMNVIPNLEKMYSSNINLLLFKLTAIATNYQNFEFNRKKLFEYVQRLLLLDRLNEAISFAEAFVDIDRKATLNLLFANRVIDNDSLWLEYVNEYLQSQPWQLTMNLLKSNNSKYERLNAEVRGDQLVTTGPLVSILMAAYNAEKTIETAALSLLKQCWQPIEIIIIDDASSDRTCSIAQNLANYDNRIKVIKNQSGLGPFVSKNIALQYVKGDFITSHDADDWAHPLWIKRQLEPMLEPLSGVKASVTHKLRMLENGTFTHFCSTEHSEVSFDGVARLSPTSTIFERHFFNKALGHWDSVRFGADSEILNRAAKILGNKFTIINNVSIFALDLKTSLTNNPNYGISKVDNVSWVRSEYRNSWKKWHDTLSLDDVFLPFPHKPRKFSAPKEMLVSNKSINQNSKYWDEL